MNGTEVLDLLARLVAIESVSGAEGAAADFAAAWLADRHVHVERLGDSVLGRIGAAGGPTLLLNSHLDTVPAGDGWTRAPFAGRFEGDVLYGRGANDAKASVAAMMVAVAAHALDRALPGTVLLALTAREETDNAGIGAVLDRCGPPDGAVTGEPTGLQVVRAQAGLAVLQATWSGTSCHAAHVARVPHENALLRAARDLAAAPPCWTLDPPHPLLGPSTAVVTMLRAGERHNVVPDRAEAVIDARLAPPLTAADAVLVLERALPRAAITIRSERLRPVETAADHPLVRTALVAAGRAVAIGSTTLSDMAFLAGVPAVKCGPGETARSHVPDEFVCRDEVVAGAAFYTRLIPAALAALVPAHRSDLR